MKDKRCNGFLLVELLIAIFIITFCFLIILGVFPVTYKAVKQSKDILFATNVARRQIERVLAREYLDYGLSLSNQTTSYTCQVEGNTSTTEFIYNVIVYPDTQTGVSSSSIKNVIVHIYKGTNPNEPVQVKIETYIAREE